MFRKQIHDESVVHANNQPGNNPMATKTTITIETDGTATTTQSAPAAPAQPVAPAATATNRCAGGNTNWFRVLCWAGIVLLVVSLIGNHLGAWCFHRLAVDNVHARTDSTVSIANYRVEYANQAANDAKALAKKSADELATAKGDADKAKADKATAEISAAKAEADKAKAESKAIADKAVADALVAKANAERANADKAAEKVRLAEAQRQLEDAKSQLTALKNTPAPAPVAQPPTSSPAIQETEKVVGPRGGQDPTTWQECIGNFLAASKVKGDRAGTKIFQACLDRKLSQDQAAYLRELSGHVCRQDHDFIMEALGGERHPTKVLLKRFSRN